MRSEAIAAIAVCIQAAALVVALWYAGRQLKNDVESRDEQARAYVVPYLDEDPERIGDPILVVKNFGATAAYDIRLEVDPPLRSSWEKDSSWNLDEVGFIKSGIPMLAPGTDVRTDFDTMRTRSGEYDDIYSVVVHYKDRKRRAQTEEFVLDFTAKRHTLHAEEKGMRRLNDHLKNLVKELHELRVGRGGPMPVVVEPRSD